MCVAAGSLAVTGCNGPPTATATDKNEQQSDDCDECEDECDRDGDGYDCVACGGDDCNDADPVVHPDASEFCNGMDDNCNGTVDEYALVTGYMCPNQLGVCAGSITVCLNGRIVCSVVPTFETCGNGIDDDCDGAVDEACGSGGSGGSGGSAGSGGTGGTGATGGSGGSGATGGTGGTGATGGSGGTAGSGGSGGSGATGGSGGSGATGGTGGTGATGGEGGSGGSGGQAPVLGTLRLEVLAQDITSTRSYAIYGYEENANHQGAWTWGAQPNATSTGYLFTVDVTVEEGKAFIFNGTVDGGQWWADNATRPNVLIGALWNGQWIHLPTLVSNGGNSWNLKVIAGPVSCPANDQDCDGYTADNADQSQKDCSDTQPRIHPGQLETTGDNVDYDCNGSVDGSGGGGGGGQAPVLGTLRLEVLAQDLLSQRTYSIYGYEANANHQGAWTWGSQPNATSYGYLATFDIQVEQGKEFVFNGQVDGGKWWADNASAPTVLIGVSWNGQWIHLPQVVSNGGSSWNLKVIAGPVSCPANDQDCDGYTADNANSSLRDCNDTQPRIRPYQLETWGDTVDYNCNGSVDPPSLAYTVFGVGGQGWQVELIDGNSWSNQQNGFTKIYPMAYNQGTQGYTVTLGSWIAPTNYMVRYRLNANVGWAWDPQDLGNCVAYLTHQVATVPGNQIVATVMEPTYCHLVLQL
jgi:hypothetical protein